MKKIRIKNIWKILKLCWIFVKMLLLIRFLGRLSMGPISYHILLPYSLMIYEDDDQDDMEILFNIYLVFLSFISYLSQFLCYLCCFVNPAYFLGSFLLSNFWSLHPIPPYQWPLFSTPLTNSFLHAWQSFPTSCSTPQYPQIMVIP